MPLRIVASKLILAEVIAEFVPYDVVRDRPDAIRTCFAELRAAGRAYAVTDVTEDEDLRRLGAACADLALLTGGSGIAMGLPENSRRAGLLEAGLLRPPALAARTVQGRALPA